jgi:hypothetical protein
MQELRREAKNNKSQSFPQGKENKRRRKEEERKRKEKDKTRMTSFTS